MDKSSSETITVGKKLVDLCKKGSNLKAVEQLYSSDAESLEAVDMPGMPAKIHGIDAIKKKNKEWEETMDVHSMDVEGPFPLGDRFTVHFKVDATDRKSKKRMKFDEVGLYTVRNGKIIREEFFYTM